MKKKLIAMAVAGLASGAALAQTNVTMYGVPTWATCTVKAALASAAVRTSSAASPAAA
jgi:hypothetical protein